MTETHKEKFEQVLRLVRDGMEQRFRRDRIVVQADGLKIKIEHPTEAGTFISREYTAAELAKASPNALAKGLLDGYGDEQKRIDLLAYAKTKFPDAESVRLLDDDFDKEIVVVELKFHRVRVLAGLSRRLWDHMETFEQLRRHMERNDWRETINSAGNRKALLGESGWVEWK
jgi:hypothetical protein